jgi:glycerate kinase
MTILIAPDSFKGSLSAREVAHAIRQGVAQVLPRAQCIEQPLSDGGEGLVEVLNQALQGTLQSTEVSGPLPGQRVTALWSLCSAPRQAVIEMAQAAGLHLVPKGERDPGLATTYGVGELILAALDQRVEGILIGLGGSATNDGGAGMAEALGVRFLDTRGIRLPQGGKALLNLASIDARRLDGRLHGVNIRVACDVQNILLGPEGATATYGPQKGARWSDLRVLERGLQRLAECILADLRVDVRRYPGGGAAGGLAAGLAGFCGARLEQGIELVLEIVDFDAALARADLVITGEGRLDAQTAQGKVLSGVLRHAHRLRKPVVAVVGSYEGNPERYLGPENLADLEQLVNSTTSVNEAINGASQLIPIRTAALMHRVVSRG